jgi:hypothetical protein
MLTDEHTAARLPRVQQFKVGSYNRYKRIKCILGSGRETDGYRPHERHEHRRKYGIKMHLKLKGMAWTEFIWIQVDC